MDDLMGKLGELLSDEESIQQIKELAQMLSSETADSGDEHSSSGSEISDGGSGTFPDISSVMKLTGLIGAASHSDRNSELLLALKPHLGEDKQQRVDKAIRLMKLLAVWNAAKESGLLNDIL